MAALLALALPGLCEAGGSRGAVPFDFLFLDAGARPVALGGAYTALSQDANAMLYNPAGLGLIEDHHLTLMHNEHFQGISQEYGAFAWKIGKEDIWTARRFRGRSDRASHGWGLMVNTVSFGKVQRTTLSNPDGTGLGKFGVQDWTAALGYGRRLGGGLSLGLAAKGLYEKIDGYSTLAPAADFGALYKLSRVPVTAGLAVQNLGPKFRYQVERVDLPLNVRAGLAYRPVDSVVLAADVSRVMKGATTIHAGAEYTAFDRMMLRVGYNGRNEADSGITAGFGVLLPGASIDYAFVPFGDLGLSHRISLSLHW